MFNMKWLAVLALVFVLAAAAYGFAAANTVDPSGAGEGSQTISGYYISGIKYALNKTASPTTITAVTFTLIGSPDPNDVEVKLNNTDSWHTCDNGGSGSTYTCTLATPMNVSLADNLTVLAAQVP